MERLAVAALVVSILGVGFVAVAPTAEAGCIDTSQFPPVEKEECMMPVWRTLDYARQKTPLVTIVVLDVVGDLADVVP